MEQYTLLVLAAGASTRFGQLKQIEAIGPNGEILIEYSLYDAIKAGFNKIIFIVNEKTLSKFQTIGEKIKILVEVEYCIQNINDIPEDYKIPRKKPWGTAHAIYAARNNIKGSFAIINADDYYGYTTYETLIDFMKNNQNRTHYLAVCFQLNKTLSNYGNVKRGVVRTESGMIKEIIESEIKLLPQGINAYPLDGRSPFQITLEDMVTVNVFAFTPHFLKYIIERFPKFLEETQDKLNEEYTLTGVLDKQIKEDSATLYYKVAQEKWLGMTYKEDKENLSIEINNYIKEGKYPNKLWD